MKIQQNPRTVVASGEFGSFDFGIKEADMGMILEILRSKLYSNPIGAICREISSNSRDANRESENNVPIEISINDSPMTIADLSIFFKDFGPGISPERMADVFVNYGSSTKRESDVFTGGFGLGAKTPFSYTDNFSIETIVDGVKYTYVAAIEEGRKGKIYQINVDETCEPNGTTIIIPIKKEDRITFENEVYKATAFWAMKPVYKNFTRKLEELRIDTKIDTNEFSVVKESFLNTDYGLLLDGIFYPINTSIIDFAREPTYGNTVIFKFNVGDLTISANRETLQYDDKTKTAINKRFVELVNYCKQNYETEFNKSKTLLEAIIFYEDKLKNVYYATIEGHIPKSDPWRKSISFFNGKSLSSRLDRFQTLCFFKVENIGSKISRTREQIIKSSWLKTDFYLFNETLSFIPAKDETILSSGEYIAIRPTNAKFLKFSTLSFHEKKELAKYMRIYLSEIANLEELGIKYVNYSLVERVKVKKELGQTERVAKTSDTLRVYVRSISDEHRQKKRLSGTYTYVKVNKTDVTYESGNVLEKDKYAVVLVDDMAQLPLINDEEISLYKLAIKAKMLPDFTIIYANKKRGVKLASLFPSLKQQLALLTPSIIGKIIDFSIARNLITDRQWIFDVPFKSKKFNDLVTNLKPFEKSADLRISVSSFIAEKYKNLSQIEHLQQEIDELEKLFPLINSIGNYHIKHILKDVIQYINVMEEHYISAKQLV